MAIRLLVSILAAAAALLAQLPAPAGANAPTQATQPATVGTARVEGRVVNLAGEPLRKATIRLMMAFTQSAGPFTPTNYTAISDAEGNFSFEDVDAGRFTLTAERGGYVRFSYGSKGPSLPGTQLTVRDGQKLTGLLLKMTPQSIVAGKVIDEDGDPVPNCQIVLYRMSFVQGRRQLQLASGGSTSQADGTFLLSGVAGGKYYLAASIRNVTTMMARERGSRKGFLEDYVSTYYPNTTDSTQAATIEVTAGTDIRGLDIRVRKVRLCRISGRFVGPANSMLYLTTLSFNDFFSRQSMLVRDGTFEFGRVVPGKYIIQLQPTGLRAPDGSPQAMSFARVQVNVSNEDVENIVLTAAPGAELSGQFSVEGIGPLNAATRAKLTAAKPDAPASQPPLRVQLMVAEGPTFALPTLQMKDDGLFTISNVGPDRYRYIITGIPDGCYIKQVRFGGQDITDSLLDTTSGAGGQLEVIIGTGAANLSGTVRNDKGDAAKDAQLTLWRAGEVPPGMQFFVRTARANDSGAYTFSNLPPGEYRVAAFEQVEFGISQDLGFLSAFESKAVKVKLAENAKESPEVKLIPFEASEVEAAKIR